MTSHQEETSALASSAHSELSEGTPVTPAVPSDTCPKSDVEMGTSEQPSELGEQPGASRQGGAEGREGRGDSKGIAQTLEAIRRAATDASQH